MFSKIYILYYTYDLYKASLVAPSVKNLLIVQGTWVQSLGQEDPQRRKWQPTPLFLPWKSHGQRSLAVYSIWECKRVGHSLATKQHQWIQLWSWGSLNQFLIFLSYFLRPNTS